MHANWWPSLLAHIPNEEPWAEASVPVASLRSFDGDPIRPGERRSYTVLIPLADIDAVVAAPAGLRSSLVTLGVAPKKLEGLRGLKLLDYVVRLSQVAVSTGYLIPSQAQAILDEMEANGTDPARPLEHLFALYDLRIVGSHAIGDAQQELVARLNRFGTEPGDFASGFGQVLDTVYDALAEELEEARRTLTSLLGKNLAYTNGPQI